MEKLTKSEKILISTGLFMVAIMVGYNAFFVPTVNPEAEFLSDVAQDEVREAENPENGEVNMVNINEADEVELTKINGIGSYLAKNIIDYREKNGGFSEISEIMNVKGIGEKLFEKIKDEIYV